MAMHRLQRPPMCWRINSLTHALYMVMRILSTIVKHTTRPHVQCVLPCPIEAVKMCSTYRILQLGHQTHRNAKICQQELKALTDKLTNMEFQAGESLEAVEKASDAYSQQVQTYRDQLVAIIDKLAAEAEDKKKTYVEKWITQLNSIHKVSQDHQHNIEAVTSQINERRLEVQEKMLFVSLKQAEILATDCQNYITSVENNVYVSPFEFKNNSELHDMLSNVGSLGDGVTSIQPTGEIDVQAASEGNCAIRDLLILSDGRLISG